MFGKVLFCAYVLFCFEVGVFLLIFPWMGLWEENLFLFQFPILQGVLLNDFIRGAVSGLGLANLILGAWEIAHVHEYFEGA